MTVSPDNRFEHVFPTCRRLLGAGRWASLGPFDGKEPSDFSERLSTLDTAENVPPYLVDLARLELAIHEAAVADHPKPPRSGRGVNPSLQLLTLDWSGLPALLDGDTGGDRQEYGEPVSCPEQVLVWREPDGGRARARVAEPADLLALKLTLEETPPAEAARAGGISTVAVLDLLDAAVAQGLLLRAPSKLRRNGTRWGENATELAEFRTAQTFTLQWHITQACELNCRHCYDRSDRSRVELAEGLALLEQLGGFCEEREVRGQVSFSGGNPLLHPEFDRLYAAAWAGGFRTGILGNPTSRERLDRILAIHPPDFFQISLEGLEPHNDAIRGPGHFQRCLEFLDLLAEKQVHAMVMLTLTRENLDQLLPLAEFLRGRADTFHFNRLAQVGEGAALAAAMPDAYRSVLEAWLEATDGNPILGLKDNGLSVLQARRGAAPFGGCTGYGCGAAFNFLSILPDGEVHACRKFPSPVGNLNRQTLAQVYDGTAAAAYRGGSAACVGCASRPVCGGCMASTFSAGEDPLVVRDPYCLGPT